MTSQRRITVPLDVLRSAGLEVGDQLVARVAGPGRLVFERVHDVLDELAGSLTGVYDAGELDRLRDG